MTKENYSANLRYLRLLCTKFTRIRLQAILPSLGHNNGSESLLKYDESELQLHPKLKI